MLLSKLDVGAVASMALQAAALLGVECLSDGMHNMHAGVSAVLLCSEAVAGMH